MLSTSWCFITNERGGKKDEILEVLKAQNDYYVAIEEA